MQDLLRRHESELLDIQNSHRREITDMETTLKKELNDEIIYQKELSMEANVAKNRAIDLQQTAETENQDMKIKLEKLDRLVRELEKENDRLANKIESEHENAERWLKNNMEISTTANAKGKINRQLENRLKECERQVHEVNAQKEQIHQEYRNVLHSYNEQKSQYENQLSDLRFECERLTSTLEKKSREVELDREMYNKHLDNYKQEIVGIKTSTSNPQFQVIEDLKNSITRSYAGKEPSDVDMNISQFRHQEESKTDSSTFLRDQEIFLKAITRILKSVHQGKQVSLSFEGVDLSKNFGKLVAGLKNNCMVKELNLNNTQLDDFMLKKLTQLLTTDQLINSLKIGYNNFS